MKLEKVKVGKKYRISFKDNDKSSTVSATVTTNNLEKKVLKFETKKNAYECKYADIKKIQSLTKFRLKWLLLLILIFIFTFIFILMRWDVFPSLKCRGWKRFEGHPPGGGELKWQCNKEKCECACDPDRIAAKPIVYFYPEEITDVTVVLGYPENTTHTYPKYNKSWKVQAEPNGDLTDLKTGRHYYALYWEGKNTISTSMPNEGFVIKGEDTISFLEQKLEQLGLTERESAEFIIYWLPKLENAKYNLIRFQTLAEQNKNMPLNIIPAPQTLIRVMMEYKNLDEPIQIEEQNLPSKPGRNGFTVIEWGGTKL